MARILKVWKLWRHGEDLDRLWAIWHKPGALDRAEAWAASPRFEAGMAVSDLMLTPQYAIAEMAVRKVGLDALLKDSAADLKRAEALEWIQHYAREREIIVTGWKARFLLELAAGVRRGHLPG